MNIYFCSARRKRIVEIICCMIETLQKRDIPQLVDYILETTITEKLTTDLALW